VHISPELERKLAAEAISPAAVVSPEAIPFTEMAEAAIARHEEATEKTRRRSVGVRVQIINDAWDDLLKQHLSDYYTTASYNALTGNGGWVDLSDNPMRDIVEELATLYQSAPTRSIEHKGKAVKDGVECYQSLFGELDGDLQLQSFWMAVNAAVEAFEDVIIWPAVREDADGKRLVARWAAGDSYSVTVDPEDPLLVREVVLQMHPRVPRTRLYAYWTDDFYGLFQTAENGDIVKQVAPGDFENPYGRLPFVHLHNAGRQPQEYWNTTRGRDLVDATLANGERRTQLRYSSKMSSFKQGVAIGPDIERQAQQLRDEGALIYIRGESGSFTTVDWQVDFQARLDLISATRQHLAASRGINPNALKRTGDYQTAEGANKADRGLIERRSRKATIYEIAERTFYRMAVIVAQRSGIGVASKLPAKGILSVEYGEQAYPADPEKRLEIDAKEASLGTKSLVQVVRERYPKMTKEEAIAFLHSNIDLNAALAAKKQAHAVASQLTNRSADDEENGRKGSAVRDNKEGLTPPGSPPDTQA
jgi:hypothetical protein